MSAEVAATAFTRAFGSGALNKTLPDARRGIHVSFNIVMQPAAMFDLATIPLFALADRKLAWIDTREQVLAQNVANADTPGWRAQDVKPFASLLGRPPLTLAAAEGASLVGAGGGAPGATPQRTELAPDGNGVVLDRELLKIADTDTAHRLTVQLVTSYLGMFRTAIGR